MNHTLQHSDNEVTFITPPIKFFCNVRGKELSAMINAEIDHPMYYSYRVKFSDGYEDVFSILESGFVEGDKKEESKAYAFAIKSDIQSLCGLELCKEIYTMRWLVDGKLTNIWIMEREYEGEKRYVVYHGGDYRFEMKRSGAGWLSRSSRIIDPEMVNEELAKEIGRLIDRERSYA